MFKSDMDEELIVMKESYGRLYQIENVLRSYIVYKMEATYGSQWFHTAPRITFKRPPKKSFNSLLFHEYERIYLRAYEVFHDMPENVYQHLHLIYPIRNKIAHSKKITEDEFEKILRAYEFIYHCFWEEECIFWRR